MKMNTGIDYVALAKSEMAEKGLKPFGLAHLLAAETNENIKTVDNRVRRFLNGKNINYVDFVLIFQVLGLELRLVGKR